jgi:hypothetical protein
MSLYIGAAVYGSCACLTCCAPGLPCCVAPCDSVNDDQGDSDLDGFGDKVQLPLFGSYLDSSLPSFVGSGLTASVLIGHAVSQLVYLSMAVLVVLSGQCDAVSCSNVCLVGCTPSGSVDPAACSGNAAERCGLGWTALPGTLGCQGPHDIQVDDTTRCSACWLMYSGGHDVGDSHQEQAAWTVLLDD